MKQKCVHPEWPQPPETAWERLLHVLDIFGDEPDSMHVVTATTNVYAPHGEPGSWTGLTLGDLRILAHSGVRTQESATPR